MVRKRKTTKSESSALRPDLRAPALKEKCEIHTLKADNVSKEIDKEEIALSISIQEKVALLAYRHWEERGRQGGSPEEDWYRAEKEILGQLRLTER